MIKSIYIKNFTLIDEIDVNFSKNLNIITGETGSGKSVIIDAFMILLGSRAEVEDIKSGTQKAVIEGKFINISTEVNDFLNENDIDQLNELIIRREINLKGNSRCFINDTPVSVNILKQLGYLLADFHGQHDNQLLLNSNNHLKLVDLYDNNNELLISYSEKYKELNNLYSQILEIETRKETNLELYNNHLSELNEINEINPKIEELDNIELELTLIENSEVLFNLTNEFLNESNNDSDELINKLKELQKINNNISRIDKKFEIFNDEIKQSIISIQEITNFYQNYIMDIDFDKDKSETLKLRAQQLKFLEKKYGSIEIAIERKNSLEEKVNLIENFDYEISKIKEKFQNLKHESFKLAYDISNRRKLISKILSANIVKSLNEMGMENISFDVSFENFQSKSEYLKDFNSNIFLSPNGIDKVEFLISTNKGEQLKPLKEIASGGEISRVMLAIKSVFAEYDDIPTLIFDEIDTGISGRIAQKVGIILSKISDNRQIISITHLPQIAAIGNQNIVVEKYEEDDRTNITCRVLSLEEKKLEIAKLISGENITNSSLQSADELINFRQKN